MVGGDCVGALALGKGVGAAGSGVAVGVAVAPHAALAKSKTMNSQILHERLNMNFLSEFYARRSYGHASDQCALITPNATTSPISLNAP